MIFRIAIAVSDLEKLRFGNPHHYSSENVGKFNAGIQKGIGKYHDFRMVELPISQ
jgi:hypothetical protein